MFNIFLLHLLLIMNLNPEPKKIEDLKPNSIIYVEAMGDYYKVFTDDNRYVFHGALKSIDSKNLIKVHRSYLINKDRIIEVHLTLTCVMMDNGKTINYTRLYRKNIFDNINIL